MSGIDKTESKPETGLRSARDVLTSQLQDPEVRARWELLAPARALALRLTQYRAEHNLSQTALGRKLSMAQPAVARLETGEHMPTIGTLVRIAEALDLEFLVDIRPATKRRSWVTERASKALVVERVTTSGGHELLVASS